MKTIEFIISNHSDFIDVTVTILGKILKKHVST